LLKTLYIIKVKSDESKLAYTSCQVGIFIKALLGKDFSQALKILRNEINIDFLQSNINEYITPEEISNTLSVLLLFNLKRVELLEVKIKIF
jgi:hypothetical protein